MRSTAWSWNAALQVVEDEDERPLGGDALEHAADCVEELRRGDDATFC